MIFIDPSVEEVYKTILNNDEIINFLKKENIIITEKEIRNNYTESEANNILPFIFANNVSTINNIAEVLVKYKSEIKELSINELLSIEELKEDLSEAIGIPYDYLYVNIYKNILYTYKYCYISSFFQNNKEMFLPENDYFELENNPAALSFYDAMMKEFDRLDSTLDQCTNYLDYEKIPWDLINYLTQLLGFEKSSFNFEDQDEKVIRELVKNILDLYRIKGTNYSFELLFSLLGYNIEIKEYYFDRRLFYLRTSNTETDENDRGNYEFYLTTTNPEENKVDVSINEIIKSSDISKQYSLKEFNELVEIYGPQAVLGYSSHYKAKDGTYKEYKEKVYKYFKTNLIYYDISLPGRNIPINKYVTIGKCLDFLTPSYVARRSTIAKGSNFDFKDTLSFNGQNEIEILDGEDFGTYGSEILTKKENGLYYNPDGTLYQNSLKKINASIERKEATNKYKVPIDYKFKNVSLNKYLTNGTGAPSLKQKRIKFFMDKKNDGTVTLYPFYTIPPKVESERDIKIKWEEETKKVNLIGKNSIKSSLKEKGNKTKITTLDKLSDFDILKSSELLSARNLENIYKIKRDSKELSLPSKALRFDLSTNKLFEKSKIDNYFNNKDVCENLIYGKYIVGYDEYNYYLYRYGNYKIPLKQNGSYNKFEYNSYINSFIYKAIPISSENKNKTIGTTTPAIEYNTEEEINKDLEEKRKYQMKNFEDINYVTNLIYYNKGNNKYYKAIRVINPDYIKFTETEGEIFLNKEYKIDNKIYIYLYKNRKPNNIYYVKDTDKFYIINNNLEYKELIDFYGRIEEEGNEFYLYQYDQAWEGYDEEADSEDFIGYNHNHKVYWKELGFKDERISRPIKYLLNKELDNMTNTKEDDIFEEVYNFSFGNFSFVETKKTLSIINKSFFDILQIEEMYFNIENFLKDYPDVFKWVSPMSLSDALIGKSTEDVQRCYIEAIKNVIIYIEELINEKLKFNKEYLPTDEYGRFLNCYHFAKDFSISIQNNNTYSNYIKDYYYKKLVSLYRYRLIDDNGNINLSSKELSPMFAYPKVLNSLMSTCKNNFISQDMLLSSYKNIGSNKEPIKIPFNKSYISDKKLIFEVSHKDIMENLGFDIVYESNNKLDYIKPVFFFDNNKFLKENRKRISKIYKTCSCIPYNDFVKIIIDLDFYTPNNSMKDVCGYLEFRNFSQSLLDTVVSYPESYNEYFTKDSYNRINQFCSFGDDREVGYLIKYKNGIKCSAFINDNGKVIIKVPKKNSKNINKDIKSIIVESSSIV